MIEPIFDILIFGHFFGSKKSKNPIFWPFSAKIGFSKGHKSRKKQNFKKWLDHIVDNMV